MGNTLKRHQLTRLPPYLILFIKRFTSNNFVKERNPTIINFPLRGIDLRDRKSSPVCADSCRDGKARLTPLIPDLTHADVDPKPSSPMASVYDLIANIPHETTSASTNAGGSGSSSKKNDREEGDTVWKVHVRAGAGGGDAEKWFALQDLDVSEVRKEMVFLGETVVQVSSLARPLFMHGWTTVLTRCVSLAPPPQVWERRDVEIKV